MTDSTDWEKIAEKVGVHFLLPKMSDKKVSVEFGKKNVSKIWKKT